MKRKFCSKCGQIKAVSEFTYSKPKKAYHYACKACVKVINKKYYLKNKPQILNQVKTYREKNLERTRKISSQSNKTRWKNLKYEVLFAYGGICKCCGENGLEFLCIDHIANDGFKHRKEVSNRSFGVYRWLKENNFPKDNFQILCQNCNASKHANGGTCVHQTPEGSTTMAKASRAKRLEARNILKKGWRYSLVS